MSGLVRWLARLACAVVVLVAGGLASGEIRGRLDRLPFAILRLARSRLPAGLRERVHDREWVPELQHVLEHAELLPLTRLLTGVRFAAGLLLHAGSVAAGLQPEVAAHSEGNEGRSWRHRLAAWPASVAHAVLWPVGESLLVRLYVAGVITAAAVSAGAAAVSATLDARDLEMFVILLGCGLAARRCPGAACGPLSLNLTSTWFLPAAVLLPPLYALIIPVPLCAADQWRRPVPLYRRVFSAAACSLAYGAASALARSAAAPAAGHMIPPGITPFTWFGVIAACQLLGAAVMTAVVLLAIKGSSPATRVLPLLVSRTAARHELAVMALGMTVTLAAAAWPPLAITILPAVPVATRWMTNAGPGPAPAS